MVVYKPPLAADGKSTCSVAGTGGWPRDPAEPSVNHPQLPQSNRVRPLWWCVSLTNHGAWGKYPPQLPPSSRVKLHR